MESMNQQPENVKNEKTDSFPCPSCGGNMVFNPETQSLECPYCNTKAEIKKQADDIKEYDFFSAEESENNSWGNEKRVIKCDKCGAETVLDEDSTAQFCPFCGSSYIVKADKSAGIPPESVIPFKVSQGKAMECFKNWIRKRYLAPGALKNSYQSQRMSGMYIPCWTYDADTYSTYTAEAGEYYYTTETDWVEENGERKMVTKQVRHTRWYFTSGDYSEYFNDILVNASNKIDDGLMSKLEPFNLSELVHYKPEFLSGFLAERYSISLKDGWNIAVNTVNSGIHSGVTSSIHADEVRNLNIKTTYNEIKYKHILLPVWISAYTYKDKVYSFMINGQTGEVQGHSPLSPWKITGLVILGILLVAAVIYFMSGSH